MSARCSSSPSAIATSSAWSPGWPTAPSTTPSRRAASSRRGCPPSSSTSRCGWRAEYCSTPARALSLLLPPKGTRAKTALWAQPSGAPDAEERLSERQRALLASLPRFAGGDLAALRRLEARGLVSIAPRVVRRAPLHVPVGAARAQPELTADQAAALRAIVTAAAGRAAAAARRHRLGQDRGLPAGGGGRRSRTAAG